MKHLRDLFVFFFNDTATTEIYTLSLHDALPIWKQSCSLIWFGAMRAACLSVPRAAQRDRKSTRLNSSHLVISYAVFCLKKKTVSTTTMPDAYTTPRSQRFDATLTELCC